MKNTPKAEKEDPAFGVQFGCQDRSRSPRRCCYSASTEAIDLAT